jgi:hypothetical protein
MSARATLVGMTSEIANVAPHCYTATHKHAPPADAQPHQEIP